VAFPEENAHPLLVSGIYLEKTSSEFTVVDFLVQGIVNKKEDTLLLPITLTMIFFSADSAVNI